MKADKTHQGGGLLHQASEERPVQPPHAREAAVRKGLDRLYHPSVTNEWNVRMLSRQSGRRAHWNEGFVG